jgi:hypothetical protein
VLPEPGEREIVLPGGLGRTAKLIARNVIDEADHVRHDSRRLADVVLDIARSARG